MHRTPRNVVALLVLSLAAVGVACQGSKVGVGGADVAAVTTATPPPGPFNDQIVVTLTTDKPAQIFASVDGSDPHKPSAFRFTGQDKLQIPILDTTTIKVFSRTESGTEEMVRTFQYVRAGGVVGTVEGEIVVGLVSVNEDIGLQLDGQIIQQFAPLTGPGKIPFSLKDMTTGTHTLRAVADRTHDGNFLPVLDYWSDTVTIDIDLSDPFKASVSGVRLLLGASDTSLCTIEGIISVPTASIGQSVSISAVDASALGGLLGGGGGGTGGAQALLSQLQNGYQVFAMGNSTDYPYAITDLQPGSYTGLPVLTAVGSGGLGLVFFVDPFDSIRCTPGAVIHKDFAFGPISLSGHVNTTQPSTNFAYGMAAARAISLKNGIEVALMPTFFLNSTSGRISASGLLDSTSFSMMAYTSIDATMAAGGPVVAALTWAVNPLSNAPGQVSFHTSGMDVSQDITTQ